MMCILISLIPSYLLNFISSPSHVLLLILMQKGWLSFKYSFAFSSCKNVNFLSYSTITLSYVILYSNTSLSFYLIVSSLPHLFFRVLHLSISSSFPWSDGLGVNLKFCSLHSCINCISNSLMMSSHTWLWFLIRSGADGSSHFYFFNFFLLEIRTLQFYSSF